MHVLDEPLIDDIFETGDSRDATSLASTAGFDIAGRSLVSDRPRRRRPVHWPDAGSWLRPRDFVSAHLCQSYGTGRGHCTPSSIRGSRFHDRVALLGRVPAHLPAHWPRVQVPSRRRAARRSSSFNMGNPASCRPARLPAARKRAEVSAPRGATAWHRVNRVLAVPASMTGTVRPATASPFSRPSGVRALCQATARRASGRVPASRLRPRRGRGPGG